jgi:ubiquitin carboxyl-terminal hydrolase 4/11/15
MRCTRCQEDKQHTKRLDVFRLPPVLIIQLKRFRQVGNQWRKLSTLIDFPIKNLNMEQYLHSQKFPDEQVSAMYDLHGIVNHYGTIGFGHYACFVRN